MKKLATLFVGIFIVMIAGIALAATSASVPSARGNDVIVPKALIDTVAQGVANPDIVAVFHDVKGDGHEVAMQFDGTNWIAPGARGADFHPALKSAKGYEWARIEDVWDTGAEFVKWRKAGPCLNVK